MGGAFVDVVTPFVEVVVAVFYLKKGRVSGEGIREEFHLLEDVL